MTQDRESDPPWDFRTVRGRNGRIPESGHLGKGRSRKVPTRLGKKGMTIVPTRGPDRTGPGVLGQISIPSYLVRSLVLEQLSPELLLLSPIYDSLILAGVLPFESRQ